MRSLAREALPVEAVGADDDVAEDFSDYATAGARASPNNTVLIDVAPLSITMETFTPGERFFTIVNHEMAHVAQMDVWNGGTLSGAVHCHGKPMPIQSIPNP